MNLRSLVKLNVAFFFEKGTALPQGLALLENIQHGSSYNLILVAELEVGLVRKQRELNQRRMNPSKNLTFFVIPENWHMNTLH